MTEPDLETQEGDSRFDALRRATGFLLAPAVFAGLWLAPLGLEPPAQRLAAVLGAVVVLWISEAIPMAMTAFLGVALAVTLGVAPAATAFAPFSDPLIFLFIGTFMLARSIFFHGLDRRFAYAILTLPGVGESPLRVLVAYAGVTCAISMWISNTATVAMMFPIGISLLATLETRGDGSLTRRYATVLLLSTSFAASIGGLATPVGTPPNLIGLSFIRRELGIDLPFFSWMLLGVPIALVLLAFALLDLARAGVPRGAQLRGIRAQLLQERASLGALSPGERNTVIAFATTVFLWVLPGGVALAAGSDAPLYQSLTRHLPEGVVALFGAGLLFVLPTDLGRMRFTLPWSEAVQIDWWIVFLYGGGIALGSLAFQTGLAEALGHGLTSLLGVHSELGLLLLSTALATVLSETTSNTASANMVVPVVIAFARSAGIDPLLPALGATLGASLGFMLPVSTPCNAIVYGSGRIPLTRMLRHGSLLDVVGVIAIVAWLWLAGSRVTG